MTNGRHGWKWGCAVIVALGVATAAVKPVAAQTTIVNIPTTDDTNADNDFGLVYAEISKKVKTGNFGPRFHAGIYGTVSYFDDNTAGAILGYEQPVSGKVSVVADWFSGKNFWGYFTPGISITLPHNGLFNIGYSIGNNAYNDDPGNDSHNKAFFLYYGVTFP